jgi:hypothetical protein
MPAPRTMPQTSAAIFTSEAVALTLGDDSIMALVFITGSQQNCGLKLKTQQGFADSLRAEESAHGRSCDKHWAAL